MIRAHHMRFSLSKNLLLALLITTLISSKGIAATVGTTDATAVCNGKPDRPSSSTGGRTVAPPAGSKSTDFEPVFGKLRVEIGTNVNLPNPAHLYGITAIGIREVGNRPCEVQIFGGLLDPAFGPDDRLLGEASLDRCGDGLGLIDFNMASFSDRKSRFVRAVSACEEGGPSFPTDIIEIKGLKIFPAQVESTGQVITRHVPAKFESPHCKKWHEPLECPCNSVLIGLVMHHRADQFTGFEVLCKSVKAMPSLPDGPAKDKVGF